MLCPKVNHHLLSVSECPMSNHDAVWLFVERRSDLHKRFVRLSDVTMRKKER